MSNNPNAVSPTVLLNSGAEMPRLGFGVFEAGDDDATQRAVAVAIEVGYRHVDTAEAYGNETGVGRAVRASGLPREQLFVTTKLWATGHADPRPHLEASLDRFGLDYVDLYLIHWPGSVQNLYREAWLGLQRVHADGLARSIGVSNFTTSQLDEVIALGGVIPAVHQIELHPLHPQPDARAHHDELGIVTQAWSPFARGKAFGLADVTSIAERLGRTESQVILRWHLQRGIVPLPKSVTEERIRENAAVFDFALADDELAAIDALASPVRVDATLYDRFG